MGRLILYLVLVVLIFYFHFELLFPVVTIGGRGSLLTTVILGSSAIWGSQWFERLSQWRGGFSLPANAFVIFGWSLLLFSLAIGFIIKA